MSSTRLKIGLLFISLLIVRVAFYWLGGARQYVAGQNITATGEIASEPVTNNGKQVLLLGDLRAWLPLFPQYHFGDKIEVDGVLSCSGKTQSCWNPSLYKAGAKLLTGGKVNLWVGAAMVIRSKFIEIYQAILPYDQASLLSGVVLGNVGVDSRLRDKLAATGLTHVVAASGMNVSIFSGLVMWVLRRMRLHRVAVCATSMLFVVFYCTITGFEPPIVRAAIMFGLTILASVVGRQNNGWWGLGVAGYLMLWAEPSLVTSASFLLSFTAMMGQIYLSGHGTSLPKAWGFLTDSLAQSFSAIVFTFPIVLVFFAKFSLVSLFTNALVLWTVEPLMVLGGLAGILGMVSVNGARMVGLSAGPLLAYFLGVVDAFSKNDNFLLRLPGLDWTFIFGYYLILTAVLMFWQGRRGVASRA